MKLKKTLVMGLAVLALAGGTVPAYAATGTTGTNSTPAVTTTEAKEGANAVNVYAEIGESYTVTIPKTITLDGTTKSGSYTVNVVGDIEGSKSVSVVPDASFKMSQTGKDDVTASITQAKNKFYTANSTHQLEATEENFGKDVTGTITASALTAGAWNGTFNFNIALNE